MYYKDYEIKKNDKNEYVIYNKFKDQVTNHTYIKLKDAKGVIDNVLLPQVGKNRYMPCHFRHFIWTILDNRTHVNVTLPDGKLLKFTNRLDAVKWCDENQEKLK